MKQVYIFFLIGIVGYAMLIGNSAALGVTDDKFVPLFGGDSLDGWKVSDWSGDYSAAARSQLFSQA